MYMRISAITIWNKSLNIMNSLKMISSQCPNTVVTRVRIFASELNFLMTTLKVNQSYYCKIISQKSFAASESTHSWINKSGIASLKMPLDPRQTTTFPIRLNQASSNTFNNKISIVMWGSLGG